MDEEKIKQEEMKQKFSEMQEKLTENINNAMNSASEGLDKTADKIHRTAEFLKEKNADIIKEDLSIFVKKYPGKILIGAAVFGFLVGKLFSK
ncbi:MAG: hypothetical protein V2B14_03495 [bacterium]